MSRPECICMTVMPVTGSGAAWQDVSTPWGAASDEILTGRLGGVKMAFLPRHGRGHRFMPTEVPYRANVHGFKQLGCQWLISLSAVLALFDVFLRIVPCAATGGHGQGDEDTADDHAQQKGANRSKRILLACEEQDREVHHDRCEQR